MAKIIPPQEIPSEYYDLFTRVCGIARPNDVVQRRYPWQIKQPATLRQVDVWDKFLGGVYCFEKQTPAQRADWYTQSQGSGLFYYDYFMKETLTLLHQGISPVYCSWPWTLCYEANERPDLATPPWDLVGGLAANTTVSEGIATITGSSFWRRVEPSSPNNIGNVIEASIKSIYYESSAPRIFIRDNIKMGGLTIFPDKISTYVMGPAQSYFMDTTDDFHRYELTIKGSIFKVYVDSLLKLVGTPNNRDAGFSAFYFGGTADASPFIGQSKWDYTCYYTGGF